MATSSVPKGFKLVPDDQEQNQAPEARGKAEAMASYLAKKGSPRGNRLDRHIQKFERLWAASPDALKEKYASRTQNALAPSERNGPPIQGPTNASLNASRPGETPAQTQARFREARMGKTAAPVAAPGGKGSMLAGPPRSAMPSSPAPVAIGTPEEQARVAAMVNEGSDFATADSYGAQSFAAAESMRRKNAATKSMPSAVDTEFNPALEKAFPGIQGKPPVAGSINPDVEKAFPGIQAEAAKPKPPAAAPYTGPMSAKPAAPVAGQPPIAGPAAVAQPTGSGVIPRPLSTTGKQMDPAIKSDTGGGLTRVNSLTGLPYGYNPGDALPKSGDAAMQQRAGDSQTRQSQAQAAARPAAPVASPMQRGPASQPLRTGSSLDNPASAFSDAAYQRSNAAVAQGVKKQETLSRAQNLDDPKKFFPGRTLPLDQLVRNQKIQALPGDAPLPPRARPVGTAPPVLRPMLARR